MPNIYVRVRHYIASYIRNTNDLHPIPPTEPINIEAGDALMDIIRRNIVNNRNGRVTIDCLSEHQWQELKQGKVLSFGRSDFQMDIARDKNRPLSIAEIYTLCGHASNVRYADDGSALPDSEYLHEYVAFRLPPVLTIDGREQRITSDFTLVSSFEFSEELRRRFGCAMSSFISHQLRTTRNVQIDQFVYDDTPAKFRMRHNRAKMEALDRFMVRYQIRPDDKTRESLKKLMNRDIMSSISHYNNDIDLARWDSENPPLVIDTSSDLRSKLPSRNVMVLETGVIYQSIVECAAAIGVSYAALRKSVSRGSKCGGLTIIYYDPNQPKMPTTL